MVSLGLERRRFPASPETWPGLGGPPARNWFAAVGRGRHPKHYYFYRSMSREHQVRLPDRFWRHSTKLSLDAKALYSILLTFTDYKTNETHVGNARLERESGCGRDKVKALILELETAGFIKRTRLYVGNLKSKRILRCLKFVSMDGISAHRLDRLVSGTTENQPLILTKSSHPSPIQKKEESSLPVPEPEKPQRVM